MNNSKGSWSACSIEVPVIQRSLECNVSGHKSICVVGCTPLLPAVIKSRTDQIRRCRRCLCVRVNMQFTTEMLSAGTCQPASLAARVERGVGSGTRRCGRSLPPLQARPALVHHLLFRLMLCGVETSAVAYSLMHCIIRYALTQFLSSASSQVSGFDATASLSETQIYLKQIIQSAATYELRAWVLPFQSKSTPQHRCVFAGL